MRILYLTQRLPFGPGESFVIPELEALIARGHEVLVVPRLSREPVMHDDAGAIVARTRTLPRPLAVLRAVARNLVERPRRTLRAFWRLRRTRPRRRAFSNTIATAQGMWVARLARAWGADHIHAHWAHLPSTIAMAASGVSGIPWSFTAHRYDVVLNNLLADKLYSARFGRFIAHSMLDRARPMVGPAAIARATVLHMGVSLPPAPDAAPPERTRPVVLCPGRLSAVKGQRYLIEAAAILKSRGVAADFLLAGDGPDEDALRQQIATRGLAGEVRLLGMLPHAALLDLYRRQAVDCVVLPSLDLGGGLTEGISVALIEAMAAAVPVISTATGGQAELLDGAAVVVPPGDSAALAAALERLLGSPALRLDIGRRGRRRVEEQFDVRLVAEELSRRFAEPELEPANA